MCEKCTDIGYQILVVRTLLIPSDWSWRLPSILQAVPSVIQVVFAFTVPESPRWLVSKDRSEEALEILIKYHAEGDASAELPHLEIAEIRKALELENESRQRGWAELFQSKGMRHRALVAAGLGVFVQYSGKLCLYEMHVRHTLTSYAHNCRQQSHQPVPRPHSGKDRYRRQPHPSALQRRLRSMGLPHGTCHGDHHTSISTTQDVLTVC